MPIVEVARYRLRDGADEGVLIEAEREIQRAVGPSHPGYVGRDLLKGAHGVYVLIMRWDSEQAADSWNSTLFQSEAGRKLGPLVDPASMMMERLVPVTH